MGLMDDLPDRSEIGNRLLSAESSLARSMMEASERKFNAEMGQHAIAKIAEAGLASVVCEVILKEMNRYQDSLDQSLAVGLQLVSFGGSVILHVESLGYQNPHLVFFYGKNDQGLPMQLIQHVQQLSFLLTTVKREHPDTERAPFGFWTPSADDKEQ